MYKEFNYSLDTGDLLSISMQGTPLARTPDGVEIAYNKRTVDGKFIERYIVSGGGFASVNQDWTEVNTYTRLEGEFEYGCNVKYVRDDGRVYYAQNPYIDASLFPNSPRILEITRLHSNIAEVIYAQKESGAQIYVITRSDQ
jgi:hypothetical protein